MSFRDLKYPLSDFQEKERKTLIEDLMKSQTVRDFMLRYHCPKRVVEENLYRFKTWLEAKTKAESMTQKDLELDPKRGAYVDLIYDLETKTLQEVYVYSDKLKAFEDKYSYLNEYRIFTLSKQLQAASFDTIDVRNEQPRYLKAVELCSKVKVKSTGVYLYGNIGVGKTYLSACVTNALAKQGHSIVFVVVSDLITYVKTTFGLTFEFERLLTTLKTCDCLVLDDLGAEPITPWSRDEILFPVLNDRMENKRLTMFTSNYPLEMLEQVYSIDSKGNVDALKARRFVDRVQTLAKAYEVTGVNRRNTK